MNDRLSRIKLLAMDVDGTLTDGSMIFYNHEQMKVFSVYDGLGIRIALNSNLNIIWVTGNVTAAVSERARTLGVTDVYQGARFKTDALKEIAKRYQLETDEIAYIGDDLNDIPAYEAAGFRFAVANAAQEVKDRADFITVKPGGQGAVREAIEAILKARGTWEDAINAFLKELALEDAGKAGPEAVA